MANITIFNGNFLTMESRLGHAKMMIFVQKCMGKKQHQKLPENVIFRCQN